MGFDSNLPVCILCGHNSDEGTISWKYNTGFLFGILGYKGESVAILKDNDTEFKNNVLNEVCDQLGIKMLFSNPCHPQGTAKWKITKFLGSGDVLDLALGMCWWFLILAYG